MTPLERFRESAKKFIRSNKDKEAIYQYSVAVWTATIPGSGLSFMGIFDVLDEEFDKHLKEGKES